MKNTGTGRGKANTGIDLNASAFTPIVNHDGIGFCLVLAEENKPDCWPLPPSFGTYATYEVALRKARELNADKGVSQEREIEIVASSMLAKNAKSKASLAEVA